ncbi:MAG: hypothetical protein ACRD8O_22930 [Bryobacteraceae bacterium]
MRSPDLIAVMAYGSTGDDSEADTGAAFTQDDSEFNIFNTDRKLAALTTAVKMLSSLWEKKALVYFASGMSRTGSTTGAAPRQRFVLRGGCARAGGQRPLRRCGAGGEALLDTNDLALGIVQAQKDIASGSSRRPCCWAIRSPAFRSHSRSTTSAKRAIATSFRFRSRFPEAPSKQSVMNNCVSAPSWSRLGIGF